MRVVSRLCEPGSECVFSLDLVEHICFSCVETRHTVTTVSTVFPLVVSRRTLKSKKGMGMNEIARKPSKELAQPTPSLLYIACSICQPSRTTL